ncbi:hypothetical protein O181_002058 [Austropuccinia psidii MF-1]|uniref:Uncharacterized protein n=1 Tax=Austropuccinia psidii MF-1 TaxID=1389203 RepID=A0A9Q3BC08_9BASI|nr:hypothetical protein [Austropuccinia psidii MF-1]
MPLTLISGCYINISPYTSKSTDKSWKPIGQIENLEVTFGNKGKMYMDFLVFQNFNQIIVEERSSILSSSEESIPPVPDRRTKGMDPEDKLEVKGSEGIGKIKE